MKSKTTCNKGFTLIELAVVLVILGLITSALIGSYSLYVKKAQVGDTTGNIKDAKAAIDLFQSKFGFYPCPADPTDANAKATNCSVAPPAGIKRVPGTVSGQFIRIGVMPVFDKDGKTMLVAQSKSLDGYGRRLAYAVTERMAVDEPGFHEGDGVIQITKSDGTQLTNAGSFLILSHGPDGRGAYTPKGKPVKACDLSAKDGENCDNANFTFVDNSNERSTVKGANNNDDFVSVSTSTLLTEECGPDEEVRGFNPTTGALKCVARNLNCGAGEAFVGLDDTMLPSIRAKCARVDAACGAGQVLANVALGEAPKCIKNLPGSCSAGFVQYGTENDENSSSYGTERCVEIAKSCPANYTQVGTNTDMSPMCVPNINSSCPPGHAQVGNNPDGSAACQYVNCPAGQYFAGINNGALYCSGDRTVNDNSCPWGQIVTGISGGNITCSNPPGGGGTAALVNFRGGGCPGGYEATGMAPGSTGYLSQDFASYYTGTGAFGTGMNPLSFVSYVNQNDGGAVLCASTQKYTAFASPPDAANCPGGWSPAGYGAGYTETGSENSNLAFSSGVICGKLN